MATLTKPVSLSIRSYQVGFGDCFLLTFHYGNKATDPKRHLLIDFGTTGTPKKLGSPSKLQEKIAEDIKTTCNDTLHGIVVTHRHKDHLSGFDGKSGKIIANLNPKVVIQPWTEHPDADPKASSPPSPTKGFVAALENMHGFSANALRELSSLKVSQTVRKQLSFLGEDNLKNLGAVQTLMGMKAKHFYVNAGQVLPLGKTFPGVTFHVLGPPTLKQTNTIKKQRSSDKDEFWMLNNFWGLQANSVKKGVGSRSVFGKAFLSQNSTPPFSVRWFFPRLENLRGEQILELVRILDKAMNNTSVILLMEVGKKVLLFPGDAQIENWEYALKVAPERKQWRQLLKKVDVYKVGHHGSRNATPKTLWETFTRKAESDKPSRLKTFLSTMNGKHGSESRGTEVPRRTLEKALATSSILYDTRAIKGATKYWLDEAIPLH